MAKNNIFLGVVERDGLIFIPWRGTHVSIPHDFDVGQNLLVELEDLGGSSRAVKAELPTRSQLKEMRDELNGDWDKAALIFKVSPMAKKVLMLRVLGRVQ